MGGSCPVRLQSMTNTSTLNAEACVAQSLRIVETGGEYVRLTAQGIREAENLQIIHKKLREKECNVPLIADIHFNPKVAEIAAHYVEKIRINPGNFVNSIKTIDYTEKEYEQELAEIRKKLVPLLDICKKNKTALRIGVNHGSLSQRILNRYGDTPEGMVASCMEFLHICKEEKFDNVVVSMKASNVLIMVQSVRLLVAKMNEENMHYPLHLGVTEAGDSEDGRIKSAVGIGALLADGIGDTIRVSLSETPENEIPVAKKLRDYIVERENHKPIMASENPLVLPCKYERRNTKPVKNIGGEHVPVVIGENHKINTKPDYIFFNKSLEANGKSFPIFAAHEISSSTTVSEEIIFWRLSFSDLTVGKLAFLAETKLPVVILLESHHQNPVGEFRAFFHTLLNANCTTPVVICRKYAENNSEDLQIKAAADIGSLLIDGFGDGVFLQNQGDISDETINSIAFSILQSARVRITKTEYISCPGCGRTLFDLQGTIAKIKNRTNHLKGLKIGIMGCIVNGPGEMADADYGYVGAAKGKISLYKKQICIEKNIDAGDAVEKLIELIKKNNDWRN